MLASMYDFLNYSRATMTFFKFEEMLAIVYDIAYFFKLLASIYDFLRNAREHVFGEHFANPPTSRPSSFLSSWRIISSMRTSFRWTSFSSGAPWSNSISGTSR